MLKRFFKRRKSVTAVDVLTGYAHWAKNYPPLAHNPLMESEEQAMLSLLPDSLVGQICLDLACGSGRYLRYLHHRQAQTVYGLDYSPDMLSEAINPKSKIQNPKLSLAPFFPLPLPTASIDLITCGLAVGHEQNLSRILSEAGRVLRPNKFILYSDIHPLGTLLGWQRSFRAENGKVFKVEHHLHLYSDHQKACRSAGLTIESVLEPRIEASRESKSQNVPVVLVFKALKDAPLNPI